jgi:hypothetical protein
MAKSFSNPGYTSELPSANERFLAKVLVHSLNDGFRTPSDFLRHFPPQALMTALDIARDLRARILAGTAGVHEKIAKRKSTAAAAEDLQLALDEGVTEPARVLELLPSDDRVRYLDAQLLWKFVVEDEFWSATDTDPTRHRRSAARLTFMLEQALEEKLVNLQDVTDGITFDEIAERLPEPELRKIVKHALNGSRTSTPLDEESLLDVVPLSELVRFIPLDHTWQKVVLAKIAGPAGFAPVDEPAAKPAEPATEADDIAKEPAKEGVPAEAAGVPASPEASGSSGAVPPAKPERKKSKAKNSQGPTLDVDIDVDEFEKVLPADLGAIEIRESERPLEDEARRRVTQRLMVLDRLPPSHASLSLPILLSIESMYADLLTLGSDEEREACIRESFPNETHLRTAMLALIELLDPNVNTKDPVISEADVDSLMKVVLFEERQRYEQARASGHPVSPVPPPVAMRRASVPTSSGLRRSATPPPLPQSATDSDDAKRAR